MENNKIIINRLTKILNIKENDLNHCILQIAEKTNNTIEHIIYSLYPYYIKNLLVVCSGPNGKDYPYAYNSVKKCLTTYYKNLIGFNTTCIASGSASKEITLQQLEESLQKGDYVKIISGDFPYDLKPQIYDIIWFAGCNRIDSLYDGLLNIKKYANEDTIILFTEGDNFYNICEKNKNLFPIPFIDIMSLHHRNPESYNYAVVDNVLKKINKFPLFKLTKK